MIIKKLSLIAALAFAASALADNYILNPIDFYVDTDSVTNVYLNGAGPDQGIVLSTDVVFDAILTPSVYDEGLCPDVSAVPDAKFALYFGQDGAATNLYVIAAGANIVSVKSFSPTNYCLNVTNETFLGDGKCRVTVYALLSVSTNGDDGFSMMGFVVFVNEEAVTCRDDDYEDKLPPLQLLGDDWNDIAKALIANKYLFPSLIPCGGSEVSSKLQDVNFVGTGRVEALRAGYAPFEAADFADVSVLIPDTPEPTQEWTAGGEPKEYGSAEEAAAAVADAKVKGITVAWPTGADAAPEGWTTGGQAKYSALFTLTSEGKVVAVVLRAADDPAIKAVEESLTDATKDIDFDAESVTVEAVPGLYYGVSAGEELDSMSVEEWTIATGDKVTVDMPERKENQTSGFYRLEASPTPTKPVQE